MNKLKFDKKLLNIFGVKLSDFFDFLNKMKLDIDGIFDGIPVIFSILINNFGVRMKIKLALILIESHVINMIQVINDLLFFFTRHDTNLFRYRLLGR